MLSQEYTLIRPTSISGLIAPISPIRSGSSASPPAVGKSRTGAPQWPQRTSVISCSTRGEYHLEPVLITARALLFAPQLDAAPEQFSELLDLVRRKNGGHLLPDRFMHPPRAEEFVGKCMEMAEPGAAEITDPFGVEAIARNSGVPAEPLTRSEVAVRGGV